MEDEKTFPSAPDPPDANPPPAPAPSAEAVPETPDFMAPAPLSPAPAPDAEPNFEPKADPEPGEVATPETALTTDSTADPEPTDSDSAPDKDPAPDSGADFDTPAPDPAPAAPETPPEDLPLAERLDRLEKLVTAYEAQRKQQEQDQKLRAHFDGLYRQGEELKARHPDFDLGRELENPLFARLTAPGTGLTVLQAWACAHAEELAAPKAPGSETPPRPHSDNRPAESGLNAQGATLSRFDYRQLSREQRENIKAAVRNARATGEKLYPPGS